MLETTNEEITNEINQLTSYVENLTPSELFQIVKANEGRIDIGASTIISVVAGLLAIATAPKENFYIIITSYGNNKIAVIKEVRAITGLGLKDAKDLVEGALPTLLKESASTVEANEIKDKLESAGATVKITLEQEQEELDEFDSKLVSLGESLGENIIGIIKELKSIIIAGNQLLETFDFDVILISHGDNESDMIKEVDTITGFGLKDAKNIVKNTPAPIKKGVYIDEAFNIKEKLESLGAIAKIISKEKDEFDVILTSFGRSQIAIIKAVRAIREIGLAEAQALMGSVPVPIKEGVSMQEALNIKEQLESTGATVEIK